MGYFNPRKNRPFLESSLPKNSSVPKIAHCGAIFFTEELGCPAHVIKAALEENVGDRVIAVFEHIGNKGKAHIVDERGESLPRIALESTGNVLAAAS